MSEKIETIFGNTVSPETLSRLENGSVMRCRIIADSRSLEVTLKFDNYISKKTLEQFANEVKKALSLNTVSVSALFLPENFCAEASADIVSDLKQKNVLLNGYFNNADYIIDDNTVNITLKFGGYNTICEIGFEKLFKQKVKEIFELNINVKFDGQLDEIPMDIPVIEKKPPEEVSEEPVNVKAPQEAVPVKKKETAPDTKIDFEKREDHPENGVVYLDNPQNFYGKKVLNPIKKMIDVTGNDTEIACWGEVFDIETRQIKTKRGDRIIVSFCFSDHTNSLYATMFMEPEDMGKLAPLKDGAFVIVNGKYKYDNYKKDYVVEPKGIALLQKYIEKDEAKEKRVELHCHTNMSAKDACASGESIVYQAYNWGHKAVAITDHGVVQAYPSAAGAAKAIKKKGGSIKVIYGIESYFVDDSLNNVEGLNSRQIAKYRHHQIILVKNLTGLKNLYKLVSDAHLNHFNGRPLTFRSKLDELREGLILGSACEQGELYKAIVDEKPHEELVRIASYYDYLEIQPIGNNMFMVRDSKNPDKVNEKTGEVTVNRFKKVTTIDVIKDYNRKVVELADELSKPVVATGDVHFLNKSDDIIRKILLAGQGFEDFDNQAPLYFKTTDEMLADFDYFGDRAREFVIDNPNKIADMIDDDVIPVPDGNFPPVIEGSDDILTNICWDNAHKMYGDNLPDIVEKRLDKELTAIIKNGYSIMYVTAQKLVADSEAHGYLVGSRGSVGSSFVATMAGISEVNPLPPHYVCPKCRYNQFFLKGEVGSGFDLPEKDCPDCGTKLNRNGHDIPFETFLGFKGDKVPDIDLNFSDEYQTSAQKFTEQLFGRENVFKAGTISTIAEKTAYGFAKAYAEKKGVILSNAELNRMAKLVENSQIKQTTGQHPAGMVVVPRTNTIYDFCPIQHPADDVNSDVITTHFDFHSIHDTILKLDELGHVVPTTYKYLEEYSGVKVTDISMSDPEVYSLFTSTKALGVGAEDIGSKNGTFCLPEFGTKFVREMLLDCKPQNFSDLLQISGLSHGTDVWLGNAKDLIDSGVCTISNVIGTRDNIMVYLIHMGLEEGRAFKITETVRKGLVAKGKVSAKDWEAMCQDMRDKNVPEWYIESCGKIKYMFPKAHAAAYVISALRIAWYKVHRPLAFYCAYFTARPEDVDVPTILKGRDAVKQKMREIEAKERTKEAGKKELDVYGTLQIFNEMMARGLEILPISLEKSHAVKYLPEDGKMRLPFGALGGVGDKAAFSLYEAAQKGGFVSKEEFRLASGASKTVMAMLDEMGVMGNLPDTNQLTLF